MLRSKGYDVLLIGRQQAASVPLDERDYSTHRMKLPFETGFLFYASYNIALFFHLLLRKTDLLFSNDLDTLLPNFLISQLRGKQLVYDSHEYFTEVPELTNRPKVQRIWKRLESWILPKLKNALTVNISIAKLYFDNYGIKMNVVRNIPAIQSFSSNATRSELGLPEDKKLIILQGSGINMHRGAEEAVEAMQYVENAVLLIIGSGDVIGKLHQMVSELKLENKVIFRPRMPYRKMMAHTRLADLGLTLDKDTNINYRYSLPNKLFDHIHAGIPTLASDLVEVKRVIEDHGVGETIHSFDPKKLAEKISGMLSSPKNVTWKENCKKTALELTWEKESVVLQKMID